MAELGLIVRGTITEALVRHLVTKGHGIFVTARNTTVSDHLTTNIGDVRPY